MAGFTLGALIQHLESQFYDGMSWDNYGEWHIDHRADGVLIKDLMEGYEISKASVYRFLSGS